ncbi:MAG TPA: class 1 fructose-bisphosphatase [Burkholderiaceae bacterium]|nr:class 1 fructose-bisphosphatase [Burkholderiaceae bacterium]
MHLGRTTLAKFLIQQLHDRPDGGKLAGLLVDVAAAVKTIAALTARGALARVGEMAPAAVNASGEEQKPLDLVSNDAVIRCCEWGGQLAGMASEELETPYLVPATYESGPYLLAFDPLDGSSNIDVNVAVGTIFSVLKFTGAGQPTERDFLQPGVAQVAAGYAIYGPSTMLVLTVGLGTHGFTLDREIGNFILTHPGLAIAEDTSEFAINSSNERFWEPPVARYVAECKAGKTGIRGRDFNMRWVASLVAEVHRILMRGGVFMYPRDSKDPGRAGRLRLLYEANPIGMVVEQAGGLASTGRGRILETTPQSLHERVALIMGSRNEVARIERYHRDHDNGQDEPYISPLFNERSLYRPEARV